MAFRDIWFGHRGSDRVLRAFLVPLSLLYLLGWTVYRSIYDLGLKRARRPHFPVICIGNLRVGGTGKTPFTVMLVKLLQSMGHEVIVSASGYGTGAAKSAKLAPEGELDAQTWGDEPALLSRLLPGVPLVVGRHRVRAARVANWKNAHATLVLDDGFQHLPLHKDLSIVLDPPCDNRFCLPAGPYREGRRGRDRADLVLPSDAFQVRTRLVSVNLSTGETLSPCKIDVLTAIENPERVIESLAQAGFEIGHTRFLPDHDPLDQPGIFEGFSNPVVVTEKDWVKLGTHPERDLFPLAVCAVETDVEPSEEFERWLRSELTRVTNERNASRNRARKRLGNVSTAALGLIRGWLKRKTVLQAERTGKRLGRMFFALSAKHRHRALTNLKLAFPEFPEPVRNAMAKKTFEYVGMSAATFLRQDNTKDDILNHIEGHGEAHLTDALAKGKGALLLTGHVGFWEPLALVLARHGFPLLVVQRDANNEGVNALVEQLRQREGVTVLSRGSAARNMMKALKENKVTGLLADQNSEECFVPFFGHPTGAALGPFELVARMGAPLIPAVCRRVGEGRYEYEIFPPLEPEEGFPLPEGYARAYHRWLEGEIRTAPEQYLWIHDRWKSARRRGLVP